MINRVLLLGFILLIFMGVDLMFQNKNNMLGHNSATWGPPINKTVSKNWFKKRVKHSKENFNFTIVKVILIIGLAIFVINLLR